MRLAILIISSTTRSVLARIGWSSIGVAGSLLLLAVALAILCHMLRDVGIDKVVAAVSATPLQAVFVACVFVFIGYCTLTLYDYFALRAVGRCEVPYPVAAFAGFTAYAIGHGLGIGLLSGGAVRLRVYSHWGLGLIEVTKIGFITGLTFWLGNIFALGLAMAIAPSSAVAATRLPVWANQVLGLIALGGITGYVVWLLPRTRNIGAGDLRLTLPSASQTVIQVAIGVVDLAVGSIATYALLPAMPATDYITVAVAYVMAALFGFLCHAPGSLGVFEVAMLVLLPQYQKDQLLASLLILHFLYLLLPLAVALLMLAVREIKLMRRRSGRAEASVGLS
jgi:glycosyltransferase 2 family protein